MAKLEDLRRGASVRGILPDCLAVIVDVNWIGSSAVDLTYKDPQGKLGNQLLFRDSEPTISIDAPGLPWSFDSDGELFRLVSEAWRIHLAYLFDPLLAVHTSLVEPLPHQIKAVYGEMLTRQPLRFLLADDPGAGKTIMAGLLIKELIARGDLHRVMIVSPGFLAEQWQDELRQRFHLNFEILTNDKLESAASGNWFLENSLVICRLDKLSRDERLREKLEATDWDLIVCDEAHKMSATFFGNEVKYTKRYRLGQLLGGITRHLLLMTATPHNGKEEDFQLFLALLDSDRFEGRFRDGVHTIDASDLMRRLTKEQLLRFDGRPLFPERIASTVGFKLSDLEAQLYKAVTEYVSEEFNRADALETGRKGTVGFALTTLQRRLASSPEAIYQSLKRRRERLEARLQEMRLLGRVAAPSDLPDLTEDDLDDLEDAPESEVEQLEEQVVDKATASRTIAELEAEILILRKLEALALKVRYSGTDRKLEELSALLQGNAEMFDSGGHRRKLVIFTEHRDTLNYLAERLRRLIGSEDAVVTIHGGIGREERTKIQELFKQDKDTLVLLATDAAGEGINLQRAHLMVNYDLPWNPNRLEQRFGRIHRIGQTEVCHLWNLLAEETREGDVYKLLLVKLEQERAALGGGVFDILGKMFRQERLRDLLIEAIRYGDRPDVRLRLEQKVDNITDRDTCRQLLEEHALARDSMDASEVQRIREDMERAEAVRLQPHFIQAYFLEAFRRLGGTIHEREPARFEITHTPALVRQRDRLIGAGAPVANRYERITFEKNRQNLPGKPPASFLFPGHPLLDCTTDLILEQNRDLLRRGAILLDNLDDGETPRVLFYLQHVIQDGHEDRSGNRRVISNRLQFVELSAAGDIRDGGPAPFLDYQPATPTERAALQPYLELQNWLRSDLEPQALLYAVEHLVPPHLEEIRSRKEQYVKQARKAVHERLTKEIVHWDNQSIRLQNLEMAGKANGANRMNSVKARQRVDELQARLAKRMANLEKEQQLSPQSPVVLGGALVVPKGLLRKLGLDQTVSAEARAQIESAAMRAVMDHERKLGCEPRDISREKRGYDIESFDPKNGSLRFIEVKGRAAGAATVTVTRNEIMVALNEPDNFILAVVEVNGSQTDVHYCNRPFTREPDFAATSVNYDLSELLTWSRPLACNAS